MYSYVVVTYVYEFDYDSHCSNLFVLRLHIIHIKRTIDSLTLLNFKIVNSAWNKMTSDMDNLFFIYFFFINRDFSTVRS